jgi:hypothetical protein
MPAALSPIVRQEICNQLATGQTMQDIAAVHDIHPRTVSRINQADKDRIVQLATRIMERSAAVVEDNHIKTLQWANGILNKDEQAIADLAKAGLDARDILKMSDSKEYRTLQIMGIIPGNTQSVILNQIIGNISVNLVDPGVRQLLGGQLNQLEDDTLDAELIDSPTNDQ